MAAICIGLNLFNYGIENTILYFALLSRVVL